MSEKSPYREAGIETPFYAAARSTKIAETLSFGFHKAVKGGGHYFAFIKNGDRCQRCYHCGKPAFAVEFIQCKKVRLKTY